MGTHAKLLKSEDPVRDALAHGEACPKPWADFSIAKGLRRLRIRFGLSQRELAARAYYHPSVVCRAEKGADVRLSTLQRLYAALGCRLLVLPAGALFELDERQAHLDNDWIDWRRKNAQYLRDAGPKEEEGRCV